MRWFDDLRLSKKIMLFVLLASVFLVGIGGIGYLQIHKLGSALDEMYDYRLLPIKYLGEMQTQSEASEATALNILQKNSLEEQELLLQELDNRFKEFDAKLKLVEESSSDSYEKPRIAMVKKEMSSYRDAMEHTIQMDENGQKAQTSLYYRNHAKPKLDKVQALLEDLTNYNAKEGAAADKAAHQSQTSAVILIMLVSVVTIVLSTIFGLYIAKRITQPLQSAMLMARRIADGDLTVKVEAEGLLRTDEIGDLTKAFNDMKTKLSDLISGIITNANEVSSSSQALSAATQNISADMEEVSASTEEIAAGLEEVSAITEELNASAEEINAALVEVNSEAEQGNRMAKETADRAKELQLSGASSKKVAENIYSSIRDRMESAIGDAKIVNEISSLASNIAGIASQTNLLALNAAIEAARAGEQGRGFSVVADEVRKLAEESTTTVENIQVLTKQVESSIVNVIENANALLEFVNTQVMRDYGIMAKVSEKYGDDSGTFADLTEKTTRMNGQVLASVDEVTRAIESVATTMQQSSSGAQEIAKGVENTNMALINATKMVMDLAENAQRLNDLIAQFKID